MMQKGLVFEGLQNTKVLHLTTTGRKTRQPRRIEIWFAYQDGKVYMMSGIGMNSNWVKNILNNSRVSLEIKGSTFEGTARVVDPATDKATWDKVAKLYVKKYGWQVSGGSVPVEITPEVI